jgi:hypothetical protein
MGRMEVVNMSKSINFKNNVFLDTSGIVHNRETLKNLINNNLKADNGYMKSPNGIIIQWGAQTVSGITVNEYKKEINFPIAFPNKCTNIQVTINDVGYGIQGFTTSVGVPELSSTKFTANFKSTSNRYSSITMKIYWLAIGY